MLALEAEFPQVGSTAWLKPNRDRPEAEPVRILQHNRDGTRLISRTTAWPREASTANLRVELDQLTATPEEAMPRGPRRAPFNRKRR